MREQESLTKQLRNFFLNLSTRDAKIGRALVDHQRAGLTSPLTEVRADVKKLQGQWEWVDSLKDGGLRVSVNGKDFYVRFAANGNLDQMTPWDNYFPEG